MNNALWLPLAAGVCMALAGCSSSNETKSESKSEPPKEAPAPAATPAPTAPTKGQVPDVFKVNMDTSKGLVVLEVHRDWAPIGADHFHELVQKKYYDGNRFFRVLKGFVVQFGLNGDPAVTGHWDNNNLPDDPVKEHNDRGTLVYATAGPGTRTTQLFINLGNNRRLDADGFAPFAKVISGMDVVDSLYGGYGEDPDQNLIKSRGNAYLNEHYPKLDYIKTATIAE